MGWLAPRRPRRRWSQSRLGRVERTSVDSAVRMVDATPTPCADRRSGGHRQEPRPGPSASTGRRPAEGGRRRYSAAASGQDLHAHRSQVSRDHSCKRSVSAASGSRTFSAGVRQRPSNWRPVSARVAPACGIEASPRRQHHAKSQRRRVSCSGDITSFYDGRSWPHQQ